jgi:hypothetical protein
VKKEEIELFLPKYLSSDSIDELYKNLKSFPKSLDDRLYTEYLKNEEIIYQGDGIGSLLAVNLPSVDLKEISGMVLSNTCDIDQSNKRNLPSTIVYAPIISLEKYVELIKRETSKEESQIQDHIQEIKNQRITQLFFLPKYGDKLEESIVPLDRLFNIKNDYIDRKNLKERRIFTLSDFGNYLFVFKISMHFTRIQDRVERKSIKNQEN